MRTRSVLLLLLFAAAMVSGCKYRKRSSTFSNYEVQCMGTGRQGTTLIKSWSYAKNYRRAVELSKKHAVHAVIFKGVPSGTGGCSRRPLASEAGAETKHSTYFANFFSDNGPYLRFVSLSGDGTVNPNDRLKVGGQYKIGVPVIVMHSELRKELEAAKIIKALNSGF